MSTVAVQSVDKLCRVCLIYLRCNPTYDLFLLPDLAKIFTVCTSLLADPQDGYPRQLCSSCYGRLNDLYDFHNLCLSSAERLKQLLDSRDGTMQLLEPSPLAINENETDPLLNHKMELIGNEEDVFRLLEHVDQEPEEDAKRSSTSSSAESDDDVPLSQRLLEQPSKSDESPTCSQLKRGGISNPIITCHICRQKFKKHSNYEEHMKHHNQLLPFQCKVESCKKGFTTAAALRLHADYAHSKSAEEIPCSVEGCQLLFPRLRLLTIHLKKVHNLSRVSMPRVEHVCSECGTVFRSSVTLKKHMYKHTGEELPYPCNICGKAFHINSALKNHLLRHAGIKNCVCPYCGVGKTTRQEWSKHLLTHTQEKMFKCDICEHATHTQRALNNHVKIVHEKIRDYACQYCGKTFGKSHTCKIHEMTHTGEKRCECKVCGKKFLYSESLTKHLKIHEKSVERAIETYRKRQVELGETAMESQPADQLSKVCAESVATIPRDPRRVERVDMAQLAGTVVNPIPAVLVPASESVVQQKEGLHFCPGCNQGFNNPGNMKRHYRSVHEKVKDFECRYCARRFANSQSAKQHEWIHTGEKPYTCKICGNHFRQEASLIRHQRMHEEKPPAKQSKPAKQITERYRQKAMLRCEKRRSAAAMREQMAEAAKEELEQLAKQRQLQKQLNTYEQYQAAAEAARGD